MAIPLASAFVRVRPQVDRAEFRKEGREAGQEAGKEFGEGFTRDSSGRIRDNRGRFVGAGTEAGRAFTEGFARDSEGRLRDASGKFVAGFGKTGEKAGRSAGKGFGKGFLTGSGVFSTVAKVVASRFALIGGAALAATPAVLNLTAALLPAVGVLTEVPAAGFAVAAAFGTVKVAVSGVGAAIGKGLTGTAKEAKKALDGLPPSARSFARSIIALKPQIEALRQSVAQRFFKPLADDVRPVAEIYLPLLRRNMASTAGALGGLAERFVQTARKADVIKGVADTFTATRLSVNNLRGAVGPLVTSLGVLIQSTAPELPKLAQGFTNVAQKVSAYVVRAVDSGRVNAVFEQGVATLKDLGGVVGNAGSILHSVFTAATTSAGSLLGNMRALTGQVAAFLRSGIGMDALKSVFQTLSVFGAALRTSLAAVLPAIAKSLGQLGPALAALAGPAAQLIVAIAPLLPIATGLAVQVIRFLTPAIARLSSFFAQNEQAVKGAAIAITAFVVAAKLSAFAAGVEAAGGIVAWTTKTITASTIGRAFTAIQYGIGVAMRFALGPIGLVITAIGLLVAALVYAFNHNKAFHDLVIRVWAAIKVAIAATVNWVVNVAVPWLKQALQAVGAAAVWLWKNIIQPVWNGIRAVISTVIAAVTVYIRGLVAEFRVIAAVATWLWKNIFAPVFSGIGKVIEIWWFAVRIVFQALTNILRNVTVAAINFWRGVFTAAFNFIKDKVVVPWWNTVRGIFELFRQYVIGPISTSINNLRRLYTAVFAALGQVIRSWWQSHVAPVLLAVRVAWALLASSLSAVYNNRIKPLFTAFVGFIRNYVVNGFKTGVAAITATWERVREAARKPVAFVVNKVINPFIGGLNKAAAIVGIKDRVQPIGGFATGGLVPGYASGGRITGARSSVDNRVAPARIPGVGAVKLAGGEFVVNAQDTARALPLLKWINDGMRTGGPRNAARKIGRPMVREPGDGSEGFAFKDGGLVGFVKDIWGAISDPVSVIKRPFEAMLSQIPGVGVIKDFLVGASKKLLGGAVSWLTGGSGTASGNVGAAQSFVRSQSGKPYVWASAGPGGYDCSGIVSAAYNILKGHSPYSHTFSTGSLPGPWFDTGRKIGALVGGWSHPGQHPASATVGHMAGMIGGMPFESTGSSGVRVGAHARRVTEFANIGTARAAGGLLPPVRLFDKGGFWPSGTLGANLSGRTEYVNPRGRTGGAGGDTHIHLYNHGVIGSQDELDDWLAGGLKRLKRSRKLPQ